MPVLPRGGSADRSHIADGNGKGGAHGCSYAAVTLPIMLRHMRFGAIMHAARLALTAAAGPHTLNMAPVDWAMLRSRAGVEAHLLPGGHPADPPVPALTGFLDPAVSS